MRRSTLAIEIRSDLSIFVFAPWALSQRQIECFVRQKTPWVLRKTQQIKASCKARFVHLFQPGEKFLFLGKSYPLVHVSVDKKRFSVCLRNEKLLVSVPSNAQGVSLQRSVKKAMLAWYRSQAKEVLAARVFKKSRELGFEFKEIFVRTQKTIWGSCHYKSRRLYFNWKIVMAPEDVIDYVIIHELCHLRFPNHSKKFWNAVEKCMPCYRESAKWLKENSFAMRLD